MDRIQEHFAAKIPAAQKEIKDFLSKHGNEVISDIKVSQLYQGMRGMPADVQRARRSSKKGNGEVVLSMQEERRKKPTGGRKVQRMLVGKPG